MGEGTPTNLLPCEASEAQFKLNHVPLEAECLAFFLSIPFYPSQNLGDTLLSLSKVLICQFFLLVQKVLDRLRQ